MNPIPPGGSAVPAPAGCAVTVSGNGPAADDPHRAGAALAATRSRHGEPGAGRPQDGLGHRRDVPRAGREQQQPRPDAGKDPGAAPPRISRVNSAHLLLARQPARRNRSPEATPPDRTRRASDRTSPALTPIRGSL